MAICKKMIFCIKEMERMNAKNGLIKKSHSCVSWIQKSHWQLKNCWKLWS